MEAQTKMLSKNVSMFMVASVATVMLLAAVGPEQAFAHGGKLFGFPVDDAGFRMITIVIGHNDEPTRAQEEGKWTGEHPMELFISDTFTGLNLPDADLLVDKYYYKNDKKFNKAMEKGFEPIETGVSVTAVHGDPGHFFARQILAEPGIYGYHVYGTVSYFGVLDVPVDVKAFCRDAPANDFTDLNFGGFGCTTDIDDGKFPTKNKKGNHDD